jgi:hypothetical protein
LELRRSRPYWGPKRLVFELAKRKVSPVPSESAAHRALVRAQMIDPEPAGSAFPEMEALGTRGADGAVADGRRLRVRAGRWHVGEGIDRVDDHSRMCVRARLMTRERTRAVCDGLRGGTGHLRCPRTDPDR